jgi:hypothetical protein
MDILAGDFRKLEESRKDYIRELIRKLVDIHCGGAAYSAEENRGN